MTRALLLALLARLVDAGLLSRDDARAFVAYADEALGAVGAGIGADAATLPDNPRAALLTAVYVAARRLALVYARERGLPEQLVRRILAGDEAATRAALTALDRLPLRRRQGLLDALRGEGSRADALRGSLAREVDRRTRVLFSEADEATFGPGAAGSARRSAGDASRWRRAITQAYAEDAATLARLGARGDLTARQLARLADVQAGHAAYVEAFQFDGLSAAQIRAGVVRQSARSRSLFFETATEADAAGLEFPVYRYIPRPEASGHTCDPCLNAAGVYLIGQGPLPSSVCLGGGWCRCEVEVYSDPVAFARLSSTLIRRAA